jgi:hypothetical protein
MGRPLSLLALMLMYAQGDGAVVPEITRRKLLKDAAAAAVASGSKPTWADTSRANTRTAEKVAPSPWNKPGPEGGSRPPPSPPSSRPPPSTAPLPPPMKPPKTRADDSRAVVRPFAKPQRSWPKPSRRQSALSFPHNFFRWCRGLSSSERISALALLVTTPYYVTGALMFGKMMYVNFGESNVTDAANTTPALSDNKTNKSKSKFKSMSYGELQTQAKIVGKGSSGKRLIKATLKKSLLVQLLEYHLELTEMSTDQMMTTGKDTVGGAGPWDDPDVASSKPEQTRQDSIELIMASYTERLVKEDALNGPKGIAKAKRPPSSISP